jgi:hypothetical protein
MGRLGEIENGALKRPAQKTRKNKLSIQLQTILTRLTPHSVPSISQPFTSSHSCSADDFAIPRSGLRTPDFSSPSLYAIIAQRTTLQLIIPNFRNREPFISSYVCSTSDSATYHCGRSSYYNWSVGIRRACLRHVSLHVYHDRFVERKSGRYRRDGGKQTSQRPDLLEEMMEKPME